MCGKIPKEFAKYLNYCRSLNFEDKPCISDLKRLFKNLMKKKNLDFDFKFDWIKTGCTKQISYEPDDDEEGDGVDKNYVNKLKELLK